MRPNGSARSASSPRWASPRSRSSTSCRRRPSSRRTSSRRASAYPSTRRGYRVVDSVQHRFGCSPDDVAVTRSDHLGKLPPQPPRGRKVEVDHTSRGYPEASCAAAECANSFEFDGLSPTPADRRVRKQQQVVPQQIGRNSAGVSAGFSRHRGEPRVGRLGQRAHGSPVFLGFRVRTPSRPRFPVLLAVRAAPTARQDVDPDA